jgi:hypothetical protein
MTTADVAAEVKCLRRLIGMRLANVYDITPKVRSPSRPFPHSVSLSLSLESWRSPRCRCRSRSKGRWFGVPAQSDGESGFRLGPPAAASVIGRGLAAVTV